MKKELAGIPLWMWGIGAAVVVGGYLWIKHQQSTAAASTPGQGGGGKQTSSSSVNEQIREWQSSPGPGPRPGPGPGPESERDALEHWTGSQHPWTWFHKHPRSKV